MTRTLLLALFTTVALARLAVAEPFTNTIWLNTADLNTSPNPSWPSEKALATANLNASDGAPTFYKPATGQTFPDVWLDRATLRSSNGASGDDFVGTWTTATLADQTQSYAYIAGRYQPAGAYPDTYLYWIYTWASDRMGTWGWRAACPDYNPEFPWQEPQPRPAIPMAGTWGASGTRLSYGGNTFTWACTTGALGKCAASGEPNTLSYAPWRPALYYQSTQDLDGSWYLTLVDGQRTHQACTRMVRADYCGDGKAHTKIGNEIDVRDYLLSGNRETHPSWAGEAMWAESGAAWISCARDGSTVMALGSRRDFWPWISQEITCASNQHRISFGTGTACGGTYLAVPEEVFPTLLSNPWALYSGPGAVLLGNRNATVTP